MMTSIVEPLYRLLGVLAPINQRMSQFRANLIPGNVLAMIVLGAILFLNFNRLMAVQEARTPPDPQPVGEVLSSRTPGRNYVAVEGRLVADARIEFDQQSAAGNLILMDYTWVPLVDRASGYAILVQFDANPSLEKSGQDVTIEGTLAPMMSALGRRLSEENYVHAGLPIDRRFVLVDGRRPGSLTTPRVVIAVAVVLLLCLVWLSAKRNVVFMAVDDVPAGGPAQKPAVESLLVSGTMTFDGRTRRFFTNVRSTMTRGESGRTVFVSFLETSSTVWGMKSVQHSGTWMLSIEPGSINEVQHGYVFWGKKKVSAIRFRFMNTITRQPDRAVIASTEADPLAALRSVSIA